MVKIRRDNVVLRVKPEDVERYHAMGYDIYGEDGQVVRPAHVDKTKELQAELDKARAELELLKAKVLEFEQGVAKGKSTKADSKKAGKKDKKE